MQRRSITTNSEEETRLFACEFSKEIQAGDVLLLNGDLGAGKTTFIQGLAKGLGVPDSVMTHSPTFTLINEYPGKIKLVHIDLYRIDHPQQLYELGLEEYLDKQRILAVEWAEKATSFWPKNSIQVGFKSLGFQSRQIVIERPA